MRQSTGTNYSKTAKYMIDCITSLTQTAKISLDDIYLFICSQWLRPICFEDKYKIIIIGPSPSSLDI